MLSSAEIRFDGWTLRRQPRELFRDGARIRLQDQPLEVLEELLTHPGEMVTREQLTARLWPKRVVDFDAALNAAVRRLRAALGDEAETPRYIETIPRRGYRFIGTVVSATVAEAGAAVTTPPSGGEPLRRGRQWPVVAALALVLTGGAILWYLRDREAAPPVPVVPPPAHAALKSIAVLPFADLSPEQDQQYFSDGLTEEILDLLAQSPELRVIARTSSFSFRGQNVDVATVARKLNVTHVLEGSVRKSGNRARITAQLVDTANSSHLWSQTYDRELDDIFEVQSDIAASVASALRVALVDKPGAARNAQAYEHLLRAHFFFQRRSPDDLERARNAYEQALQIDPGFASAWAGLAGVYWIQTTERVLPRDAGLEKLRDAAERALALDPDLAEAHLRLATYLWNIGNASAAHEHHRRAAALAPNNPLLLGSQADFAARNGQLDRAIELRQRAVAADPLSVLNHANLAASLLYAERFHEAKTEFAKVLELDPSRHDDIAASVLVLERRFDQALNLVQSWPESGDRAQHLAFVYDGLGRKTEADAALEALIAYYGNDAPWRIAEVYAHRGEIDAAFKWLNTATQQGPQGISSITPFSPFLKPLHTDPRWDAWVASAR